MNKIKNINVAIIINLVLFFLISIISIYSATKLTTSSNDILIRQVIWYIIGFLIILIMFKFDIKKIVDKSFIFYVIVNVLLVLLLFFGKEINGSKCWFSIPGIGSFQPSEFMKLILILVNTKVFKTHQKKYEKGTFKTDLILFIKIMIITLIPSILTFLEPDTGIVIIYFLISFVMLFCYGVKKSIFLIIIVLFLIVFGVFFFMYFNKQETFINVFGTKFFYRIDRLLDWSSESGMQLTNATSAIKAAGLKGYGITNTPIYIPEAHTDFIFSVYSNNTGFIGSALLIILILIFDFNLIRLIYNNDNNTFRFIVIGFLSMILYQQIQNIGMNIGLLPITGITLPFISYGGSSLLSYMIGVSLIISLSKKEKSLQK